MAGAVSGIGVCAVVDTREKGVYRCLHLGPANEEIGS
jgi:hypothetical protein